MSRDLAQKITPHQFRECSGCWKYVRSGYLVRRGGSSTLFCCETCFQKKYRASCRVVFSFGDLDSLTRALADCCNLALRLARQALLATGSAAILLCFLLSKPEIRPLELPELHIPPTPVLRSADAALQQLTDVYDRLTQIQGLEAFL